MEFLGLVFSFLHFYRRIIIGFFLVLGLAYFLLIVRNDVPKPSNSSRSKNASRELDPDRTVGRDSENPPASLPEDSSVFDSDTSDSTADMNDVSHGSTRDKLLTTGSIDDLLNESLKIKSAARAASPAVSFSLSNDQKKLSEHLLTMSLNESQKRYATRTYIEALSMLDSLNNQANFGVDSVAQDLHTEVARFLDDPDEQISSLANLAMVISPGTRFLGDASLERLDEVAKATEQRLDKIATGARSTRKLGELILAIKNAPVFKEETKAYATNAQQMLEEIGSESCQHVATIIKEGIHFGDLELGAIVERMSINRFETNDEIDTFFEKLEEFPDASLRVHQFALNIIRESIKKNDTKRAAELIEKFEKQILPAIPDEKKQELVRRAIDDLKRFLR